MPIWYSDPFSREICTLLKREREVRGEILCAKKTMQAKDGKKETKRYEMSVETVVPHSCCWSAEVQSVAGTVVHCSRRFRLDISCLRRGFPLPMFPGWQCSKHMGLSLTIHIFCTLSLFLFISQRHTQIHTILLLIMLYLHLKCHEVATTHPAITRHWASSLK